MELKIVQRYYSVTITKLSQFCKTKQFLERFGNIKITINREIKLTRSLTIYLAFSIFDSIKDLSIWDTFKNMCFEKGRRCCPKKLQKVKQGAWVLT